jgi:hypothetical protein
LTSSVWGQLAEGRNWDRVLYRYFPREERGRMAGGGGGMCARSVALGLERNSIIMHPKHERGAPWQLTAS